MISNIYHKRASDTVAVLLQHIGAAGTCAQKHSLRHEKHLSVARMYTGRTFYVFVAAASKTIHYLRRCLFFVCCSVRYHISNTKAKSNKIVRRFAIILQTFSSTFMMLLVASGGSNQGSRGFCQPAT